MSLLSRANRVVCSSLELAQSQPPNTLALLLDCPGSEQQRDFRDEEWFIFLDWTSSKEFHGLAPGGHIGVHSLLPRAVLKPEVHRDAWGPIAAGPVLALVTREGQVDICGLRPC